MSPQEPFVWNRQLLSFLQQLESDKNQLLSFLQQLKSEHDTQISELTRKIDELENQPEKIIEVIKEVEVINTDKNKLLQETIIKLHTQIRDKDKKISELEEFVQSFNREIQGIRGTFLRSSNLKDDLYKYLSMENLEYILLLYR